MLIAFRTVKLAMKRWQMNETNLMPLFCCAFISTYYCLALQWFLFHNESDAVLKFNRMSFYITRTLLGVQYQLVTRSLHHNVGVIGTQCNTTIFIIKTINVDIDVLHGSNRSCRHQACKKTYTRRLAVNLYIDHFMGWELILQSHCNIINSTEYLVCCSLNIVIHYLEVVFISL
jgi:hypothetical protein